MTVAVAIAGDDGTVYMGADGLGTHGGDYIVWCPDKLWTYHDGKVGMAIAGAGRLGQELRHEFDPPPLPGGDVDDRAAHDYLVQLARAIEDHLHAREHLWAVVADEDDTRHLWGSVLVGFAGRVIWMGGDFVVNRCDPKRQFSAIGSGGAIATGALDAAHRLGVEPRRAVALALEAAAAEVAGVGPPFLTIEIPPA